MTTDPTPTETAKPGPIEELLRELLMSLGNYNGKRNVLPSAFAKAREQDARMAALEEAGIRLAEAEGRLASAVSIALSEYERGVGEGMESAHQKFFARDMAALREAFDHHEAMRRERSAVLDAAIDVSTARSRRVLADLEGRRPHGRPVMETQTSTKHTPGPWVARWLPDPDVTEVYICAFDAHDKKEEFSIYEGGPTLADPAANFANMTLMAEAPEMFNALTRCANAIERYQRMTFPNHEAEYRAIHDELSAAVEDARALLVRVAGGHR